VSISSFALAGEAVPLRDPETSLRRPPVFETGAERRNGNPRIPSTRRLITVPTAVNASSGLQAKFYIRQAHRQWSYYSERISMLVGQGFDRLEQRITAALCSGGLSVKESGFLQNISRKIGLYRDRAFISGAQASWLFTILTRFEQGTNDRSNARRRKSSSAPSLHSSPEDAAKCLRTEAGLDGVVWPEEEEGPKAFDISDAIWSDSDV
jgi:hypothetical protein